MHHYSRRGVWLANSRQVNFAPERVETFVREVYDVKRVGAVVQNAFGHFVCREIETVTRGGRRFVSVLSAHAKRIGGVLVLRWLWESRRSGWTVGQLAAEMEFSHRGAEEAESQSFFEFSWWAVAAGTAPGPPEL